MTRTGTGTHTGTGTWTTGVTAIALRTSCSRANDVMNHRKVFVGLLFEVIGSESRFKAGVVSVNQSNRCFLTLAEFIYKCNVCFNMF